MCCCISLPTPAERHQDRLRGATATINHPAYVNECPQVHSLSQLHFVRAKQHHALVFRSAPLPRRSRTTLTTSCSTSPRGSLTRATSTSGPPPWHQGTASTPSTSAVLAAIRRSRRASHLCTSSRTGCGRLRSTTPPPCLSRSCPRTRRSAIPPLSSMACCSWCTLSFDSHEQPHAVEGCCSALKILCYELQSLPFHSIR
jgi:hypothetical protein